MEGIPVHPDRMPGSGITYYNLGSPEGITMVKTPCQQIVWDVLPAIRAALAAELVKNGVSRQEVARLMDTAPSAVSQYLSGKRGYRIVFEAPVQRLIEDLARDIKAGGMTDITARICAICHKVRDDEGPCLPVQEPASPDSGHGTGKGYPSSP